VKSHDDLSIHVRSENERQVFELTGSLDIATSPTVRAALIEASERGDHTIIADLRQLEFIDSTGLGALIGAQRRAKEFHGDVRLVVNDGQILRLLRITGLVRVFGAYHSVEDAIAENNRIDDL